MRVTPADLSSEVLGESLEVLDLVELLILLIS